MYRNNKFRKGFGKRKRKTPTQKAFSAGFKAGLRSARRFRSKRWN